MPGLYDLLTRPRICAASELAGHWMLPPAELDQLVDWEPCRQLEPPAATLMVDVERPRTSSASTLAAIGDYPLRIAQGERADGTLGYVCMLARDLLTGMVVAAPPGCGKSHFAKVLIGELLRIGAGMSVTDFKGDLVTDMLSGMLPREREAETRLFDLADAAWPVALNPLHHPRLDMANAGERGLVTDSMMGLIGRIDPSFKEGPGMQEFCRNAALAVLEGEPSPDPLKLHRFMVSERYRARVVAHLEDGLVREFWEEDFPRRSETQKASIDALVRRLGLFLMQPAIRHMVCRDATTLNYRQAMDGGQIMLASLPVEVIGVQAGTFAAQALQALLTSAGFSRTLDRMPESERRLFVNLIDEFHKAVDTTDARDVEAQLARMRGMGVANVYLYQSAAQLPPELREQLEAIVASYVCLGAFGSDVALLTRRWPQLTATDILGMRRRVDMYLQIQVGEDKTPPFRARPLPLWPLPEQPPLGTAPFEDWRTVQASPTAEWHPFVDERCRALSAFERAATAERDEARALRAQAALLRRGEAAAAGSLRDSWERSRSAWPDDAQELLARAAAADERARTHERTPLRLLTHAPEPIWAWYRQRSAEHRSAQRRYILEHPACIPDPRQRMIWLSRLLLAEPALDVAAYVERTLGALSASGRARLGRDQRSARSIAGGANSRLHALPPLAEDERSDLDVIEAALPLFESVTGVLDGIPVLEPKS